MGGHGGPGIRGNAKGSRVNDRRNGGSGLPVWLTSTVVLGLLGLFGYNIVIVGPEGYPTNVLIAGLLGAYAGIDQLLKRRRDDHPPPPPPAPPPPVGEPPT